MQGSNDWWTKFNIMPYTLSEMLKYALASTALPKAERKHPPCIHTGSRSAYYFNAAFVGWRVKRLILF